MRKTNSKTEVKSFPRRYMFFRVIILFLCAYLAYNLISDEIDLMVKKQEVETLTEQLADQKSASTELERLFGSSDDIDAYYEKIARDELGYAYPDEWIFMDITGK